MKNFDLYASHIYSYRALRRAVGLMGFFLPIVLMIGGFISKGEFSIEPSISDYYHTVMGDVFVGTLCATALFLFFYSGYNVLENRLADFGGLMLLGTAFVPTSPLGVPSATAPIHLSFATAFLLAMAVFSIFLFRKYPEGVHPPARKMRNRIYLLCGMTMLVSLAAMLAFMLSDELKASFPNLIFFGEWVALSAFGISWLVKGGAMFSG